MKQKISHNIYSIITTHTTFWFRALRQKFNSVLVWTKNIQKQKEQLQIKKVPNQLGQAIAHNIDAAAFQLKSASLGHHTQWTKQEQRSLEKWKNKQQWHKKHTSNSGTQSSSLLYISKYLSCRHTFKVAAVYLTRWADTADWKWPGWTNVCKTKNSTWKRCICEQVRHTKLAIFPITTKDL